jgi:Putative adhesin
MPATRTIALAATLGLLTIGAAAGCTGIFNRLEDGVVRDGAFTGVSITGGSGDVTVATDPTVKGIDIRRTVRYLKNSPSIDDTITFTGAVVTLKTDCGSQCSASYQVRVPTAGLKVDGSNGSGNIRLQGVSDVDIELGSGDVTVDGASGTVRVKAGSGNVELADVAGPVTVNSGSGNMTGTNLRGANTTIDLSSGNVSLDVPGTGDVKAVTSSGDIDVLVPDHACRVTADSSSGDLSIQVSTDTASTHLIDLRTGSGNVTVKPTVSPSP